MEHSSEKVGCDGLRNGRHYAFDGEPHVSGICMAPSAGDDHAPTLQRMQHTDDIIRDH